MIRKLILAGLFTLLTALAGYLVQMLFSQAWHKSQHAPTPSERPERYNVLTKTIWTAVTGVAASVASLFVREAKDQVLRRV